MKTTTIQPYLFFGGRCEAAIEFYRKGLGAQVAMLMRYNESPEPAPPGMLQAGWDKKIMHACLTINGAALMMSDGCNDKSHFDGFQLSLALPREADAQRAFAFLSDGGQVRMPLGKTFWSPCFGMVTDRFGVAWMVTVASEQPA